MCRLKQRINHRRWTGEGYANFYPFLQHAHSRRDTVHLFFAVFLILSHEAKIRASGSSNKTGLVDAIPQNGHLFLLKVDSSSRAKRTLIPVEKGQGFLRKRLCTMNGFKKLKLPGNYSKEPL